MLYTLITFYFRVKKILRIVLSFFRRLFPLYHHSTEIKGNDWIYQTDDEQWKLFHSRLHSFIVLPFFFFFTYW